MYKLCFGLNLSLEEVVDFFRNVYFECPFNFRVCDEAVYYHCFSNGLTYSESIDLKYKVSKMLEAPVAGEITYDLTTGIGIALKDIHTEEEFLDFISKNVSDFHAANRTAYKLAKELIDDDTKLAKKFYEKKRKSDTKIYDEAKERSRNTKSENNISLLLFMIFDTDIKALTKDETFSRASGLPEIVKSNFPLNMQLSKIYRGEKVSYEKSFDTLEIL